ncbi:hypothetical protein J7E97_08280 [Streptomyces sp. ISL-66]|uniref:hypothetical protein n=1 Tax=Streptomyces sp. ISL-66 TaxID=2819186 RepID=UPI001BE6209E|nr:hypothetical protein [Streptomyces sp. ISL-66]MBT2467871.1 hypothetical protein [Streptomyces sp. ISL-66]
MADDSRARLIAYLCQAGLSTRRAHAVLDDAVKAQKEENDELRERLRKAERAANLLAADHRAVERVQRRLDAWEERLPANVAKATVIDVLRQDLDGSA